MEENERRVRFTNTYTTNERTDRQMFRRIRRVPRLIVFSISAAVAAYLIYLLCTLVKWAKETGQPLTSNSSVWLFVLGLLLIALLIVREILAPGTLTKRQAKQLTEAYGTANITIEAAFTDDAIDFHNLASEADLHLPLDSLNYLTETEDLFLIRTEQRQVIALAKNGFSGVDDAGYRAFMEEKCPTAKRTWKKGSNA